jgi:cytochrome o ubiquinol oxidase subunit 2
MTKRKYTVATRFMSVCAVILLSGCSSHMGILDPKGPIGAHEKSLILTSFLLMMIVVIPVFLMAFIFPWKYRASNKKATYAPKWAYSGLIETVVWVVPALIVCVLGFLVWKDTHALSPYRPLASKQKPIHIEAISMDWKWLFIYPDQHIATVNRIEFPTNVPVNFRVTSDTVMTSFMIPRLGSQIYAMAGMQTEDHLLADQPGSYVGRNVQFSGRGFSSMRFQAVATSEKQFKKWVAKVKHSQADLDLTTLKKLEKPSATNRVTYYSAVYPHLFDYIIHKYMAAKTASVKSHA